MEDWSVDGLVDDNCTGGYPPSEALFRRYSFSLLTAFSALSAALNGYNILLGRHLLAKTGDPTHMAICSMATADLLLCCFAQPFDFALERLTSVGPLLLPDWLCRLQHGLNWLGYSVSGLSLTLLNVDKLIFFKWPLHYARLTPGRSAYAVLASWIVCSAAALAMIVPATLQLSSCGDCATETVDTGLYLSYSFFFCILPVASSSLVSVCLARLVRQMRRSNYQTTVFSDSTVQQRLRAMAFIFFSTAWTCFALLPYRLFNVLRLFYAPIWQSDPRTIRTVSWLGHVFLLILSLNPIVNPCITLFVYAPYKNMARHHFEWLKSIFCRPH